MTSTTRALRQFGLTVGGVTIGLFGLVLPWLAHGAPQLVVWPLVVGLALMLAGLVMPVALAQVHWLWLRFGAVMGWINTRIVLLVLFYAVITPIGLLMRLTGRDPLQRRGDPGMASYRIERLPTGREGLEKPY